MLILLRCTSRCCYVAVSKIGPLNVSRQFVWKHWKRTFGTKCVHECWCILSSKIWMQEQEGSCRYVKECKLGVLPAAELLLLSLGLSWKQAASEWLEASLLPLQSTTNMQRTATHCNAMQCNPLALQCSTIWAKCAFAKALSTYGLFQGKCQISVITKQYLTMHSAWLRDNWTHCASLLWQRERGAADRNLISHLPSQFCAFLMQFCALGKYS